MATVRFLQISDLHLGAPFAWLSRERRAERRREQRGALERAIRLAADRGVNAILIPGDLFDTVDPDAESLAFATHAFRAADCPPVFVTPGNHDPFTESASPWSTRLLGARGFAWPEHVHVFTAPRWTAVRLGNLAVRVWGRGFAPGLGDAERPLAAARAEAGALPPTELHVGLFHGSLEGHLPPGQKLSAPFSMDEVQAAPFAWMAVGHYHRAVSHPHFAYAGSAIALDPTETGGHGVLEVRLEFGAGPVTSHVEAIELDPRRAYTLEADVTGAASAEQVDRRIAEALAHAGASERDFARVRVTGRLANGVRWSAPGDELQRRLWSLRVDASGLRPEWDLDALRHGSDETTEVRFARVLLEQLDREVDPAARATIERALYYGLDAFRLREVRPGWEEIEA